MKEDKRIRYEYERLMDIFKDLDDNALSVASGLIQEASFMSVLLSDLRESIQKNGVIDKYQNGANQYGTKESAELKSYNATMKNYKAIIDKLLKMAPPVKVEKPLSNYEIMALEKQKQAKEWAWAKEIINSAERIEDSEIQAKIRKCREDAGMSYVATARLIVERDILTGYEDEKSE